MKKLVIVLLLLGFSFSFAQQDGLDDFGFDGEDASLDGELDSLDSSPTSSATDSATSKATEGAAKESDIFADFGEEDSGFTDGLGDAKAEPAKTPAPQEDPFSDSSLDDEFAETTPEPLKEDKADPFAEETPEQAAEPEAIPEPEQIEEVVESVPAPEPFEATAVAAPVDDGPDLDYEARLAETYRNYYFEKTPEDEWKQVLGSEFTESYEIQKGDNLWEISTMFFGSGHFWPKLWSMNSKFRNPHSIEIGDKIKFRPGSMESEPAFEIKKIQDETGQEFRLGGPPAGIGADIPVPPSTKFVPVLKRIPPSLPAWNSELSAYDDSGFAPTQVRRLDVSTSFVIPHYAVDRFPSQAGTVKEVGEGNREGAGVDELIVVRGKGLQIGAPYSVVKFINKDGISIIENHGEINITQSAGKDMYRAKVKSLMFPLNEGDVLVPGPLPTGDFSLTGAPASAQVKVIGGYGEEARQMFSNNSIVFLGGGTSKGLQEGSLLSVLKNPKGRDPDTVLTSAAESIGVLKVLRSGTRVATAVVIKSSDGIIVGDLTASYTGETQGDAPSEFDNQMADEMNDDFGDDGGSDPDFDNELE